MAKKKSSPAPRKKAPAKRKASKGKEVVDPEIQHRRDLVTMPSTRELVNTTKKKHFLEALADHGTIMAACQAANISRMTYYLWTDPKWAVHYGLDPEKHYDQDFQLAVVESLSAWKDVVMQTGYDRAITGWIDEHFDRNGVLVKREFRYDSSILQMLMKRADPTLRDKAAEINVDARSSQSVTTVTDSQARDALKSMSPAEKRKLAELIELRKANAEEKPPIEGEVVTKSQE